MKRLLLLLTLLAAMTACRNTPADPAATSAHPRWSYRSVIYEMNVRQYTPEGTLRAAMRELPRLQKLGIDVVCAGVDARVVRLRRKLKDLLARQGLGWSGKEDGP